MLYKYKFFYDAHRACADVCAGTHLCSQVLPSGDRVLQTLIKTAQAKSFRVLAVNAGYGKKDILKSRGYQWDPDGKPPCWHTEVDEQNLGNELEFLKKEIYQRDFQIPIHKVNAYNRFSSRLN